MNATARTFLTRIAALFIAVLLAAMAGGCATAQSQPRGWSRAELDQLLAPVALYPDALLAQLLIAATYPDEIVVAARWSRMHPELDGEDAVRAADAFDWDPSVKSLLAFPGLLERMDANIDWTRELGDAFLAQEQDVMDAVQGLRRRARIAGALASDGHIHVAEDGPRIHIAFASPALVYLPYYDPRVVYGRWWWPAHPPVVWAPWPGYRFVPRASGISVGFWWSSGVRLSVGFFYGGIDWPRREVRVVRVDTWYVHRAIERRAPHRVVVIKPGRWHHESTRRHAEPRPRPHAPQAAPRPAPPREARRPEVRRPDVQQHDTRRPQQRRAEPRQPEARERSPSTMPQGPQRDARRPDARRPGATRPEARRPESRQPEARERSPSTMPQAPQHDARRPDAQRPEATRLEERRPEPRQPEARKRPTSTVQAAPGRDSRRPDAQRPQAGDVRRDANARPRATSQRAAPRDVRRPQPAREAAPPQPQQQTDQTENRPEARPQPRSAPERGPRNADDARERGPQG